VEEAQAIEDGSDMDQQEADAIWQTLKELGEAIGDCQARNRAHSYIAMEIVRDLARQSKDPSAYIASMFERISARADRDPPESEAHSVNAEFRRVIGQFFSLARKGF
jgi:hypothetical protein